jgi:hypothetical protein
MRRRTMKSKTMMKIAFDTAEYTLNTRKMWFTRIMHMKTYLLYIIRNIRTSECGVLMSTN